MAINISMVGDAASVIREAEKTGTALSEVVDELGRLDDAGRDSGAGMTRSLGDVGGAAQDLTGELDEAARAAADIDGDEAAARLQAMLGDASDSADTLRRGLDDASDAGDRLGQVEADKLSDDLQDAGRAAGDFEEKLDDATSGAERFEDKMRRAFQAAEDQARESGKKIGTSVDDGFDRASSGAEEFRDEANSTAREAAASFDGSAESIGDAFQEVAANAFAGFGPAGALAGMAIAAGIGIGIAKLQELSEENTAAREAASALGDAYIEAGGRIEELDLAGMIRSWGQEVSEDNWLSFWADESESNFTRVRDAAQTAGIDIGDAMRGTAGSAEDATKMLELLTEQERLLQEQVDAGYTVLADGVVVMDDGARAAEEKLGAIQELKDGVQENVDKHAAAQEIEELYAESIRGTIDELKRKNDLLNEQADVLSAGIESELDYRQAVDDATEAISENGATLDTQTEKGRKNWEALLDLAESSRDFRDAQLEAGTPTAELSDLMAAQRDRFIKAAEAAGMEADEARALAKQLGLVPTDIQTDFSSTGAPEIKRHQKDILANENIGVSVKFKANTFDVDEALDRIRGSMSNLSKTYRNWL